MGTERLLPADIVRDFEGCGGLVQLAKKRAEGDQCYSSELREATSDVFSALR